FGLNICVMLLLSPVAWGHYFVLLLLPLAVTWMHLPHRGWLRFGFWALVIVLAVKPIYFWHLCGLWDWRTALVTPWNSLTALSVQLYALLALFIVGTTLSWQGRIQKWERCHGLADGLMKEAA